MSDLLLEVDSNISLLDDSGLYDYESYFYKQHFLLNRPTTLLILLNRIKTHEELTEADRAAKPLINISKKLTPSNEPVFNVSAGQGQATWLIVSRLPKVDGIKGFKLSRGDTLKFGNYIICVKDFQEHAEIRTVEGPKPCFEIPAE